MTNIPLIEAQEISFERGGREIASNINILLNKGEVYFVKGKNGCGKMNHDHHIQGSCK